MKFISCKTSVRIPRKDGTFVNFPAHYLGKCPEDVMQHWYFKALCKDGTITYLDDSKDSTVEDAQKTAEAKKAQEAADTERKRLIDDAKNTAKEEAEKEAKEKGLTAPETKKLVVDRQREAIEKLTAEAKKAQEE